MCSALSIVIVCNANETENEMAWNLIDSHQQNLNRIPLCCILVVCIEI